MFIGGGGDACVIEKSWAALKPGGRLVANAITLDTEKAVLAAQAKFGGTLTRLSVERLDAVGGKQAFRPAMTVTQWSAGEAMTVHFIGAGPGAPDLLTLRGATSSRAARSASMPARWCIQDILALCPEGRAHRRHRAHEPRRDRRRVRGGASQQAKTWRGSIPAISRCGAPSASSFASLDALGIPYTLTPGVPAFAAAAAALKRELTLPEVAQSLVLTRTSGRASAMPPRETLAAFAATGATLVLHLSIQALARVVEELTPFYGADCPAAVVVRASWPDERIIRATLGTLLQRSRQGPAGAHRPDPRRPGARRRGFPRQRALRRELPAPLPLGRRGMNGFAAESMPDELPLAVEDRDVELDVGVPRAPLPRPARRAPPPHRRARCPRSRQARKPLRVVLAPTMRRASSSDPPAARASSASAPSSTRPRAE